MDVDWGWNEFGTLERRDSYQQRSNDFGRGTHRDRLVRIKLSRKEAG
jgi:hypothetical protein